MKLQKLIAEKLGIPECSIHGHGYRCVYNYQGERFLTTSDLSTQIVTYEDVTNNLKSQHVENLLKGFSHGELPPVGSVCEVFAMNLNKPGRWDRYIVLAYGKQKVFIQNVESGLEYLCELKSLDFRPVLSESDQAINTIREIIESCTKESAPETIFNAIKAGRIKI